MIHKNTEMHFYFLRHGQSLQNEYPDVIGGRSANTSLTVLGEAQASAVGQRLARHFARERARHEQVKVEIKEIIISSTLVRAWQTAGWIARALGQAPESVMQVPALDELSQGQWEHWPRKSVYTPERLALMGRKGPWFVPPQGESQKMVQLRIAQWLEEEMLQNPAYHGPAQCFFVVVGSGVALRCLFQWILGFDARYIWQWEMDNTALSYFRFDHLGWHPVFISDTAHLWP